eukprot:6207472-Pleurochrysis_carterae.AAC.6
MSLEWHQPQEWLVFSRMTYFILATGTAGGSVTTHFAIIFTSYSHSRTFSRFRACVEPPRTTTTALARYQFYNTDLRIRIQSAMRVRDSHRTDRQTRGAANVKSKNSFAPSSTTYNRLQLARGQVLDNNESAGAYSVFSQAFLRIWVHLNDFKASSGSGMLSMPYVRCCSRHTSTHWLLYATLHADFASGILYVFYYTRADMEHRKVSKVVYSEVSDGMPTIHPKSA